MLMFLTEKGLITLLTEMIADAKVTLRDKPVDEFIEQIIVRDIVRMGCIRSEYFFRLYANGQIEVRQRLDPRFDKDGWMIIAFGGQQTVKKIAKLTVKALAETDD